MRDLDRFLSEDLGERGDLTTRAVLGAKPIPAAARIYAREPIVAAGLLEAAAVLGRLGCRATSRVRDGDRIASGRTLLSIHGSAQSMLSGERLVLNLIGRMSGIATLTRRIVDRVHTVNPRCAVAATRKTTPGFRWYEKRAVVIGGGDPHRFDLSTGLLIKDNHVAIAKDVRRAVARARDAHLGLPVEIEVSTWKDAQDAIRAGADWLLLDNLAPGAARTLASKARRLHPGIRVEVSGGLDEKNVTRYAPFADRVSLGRLTHSAPAADVTLDIAATKR